MSGEPPPAQYENWYKNLVYQWIQWLNDGDMVLNDITCATLGVSGAATVGGTLGVTGNTTLGGTLGVTGLLTSAAITASGLITANAGLTAGANQHITVSGTGRYKHDAMDLVIPASSFVPVAPNYATTVQSLGDDWQFTGGPPNDVIQAGIPLPVGKRILSITWHFDKASSSSALTMELRKRNGTTNTTIDSLADASSGASYTSVTRSSINSTIAPGDATSLRVQAGSTAHRFSHAVISYDHP